MRDCRWEETNGFVRMMSNCGRISNVTVLLEEDFRENLMILMKGENFSPIDSMPKDCEEENIRNHLLTFDFHRANLMTYDYVANHLNIFNAENRNCQVELNIRKWEKEKQRRQCCILRNASEIERTFRISTRIYKKHLIARKYRLSNEWFFRVND